MCETTGKPLLSRGRSSAAAPFPAPLAGTLSASRVPPCRKSGAIRLSIDQPVLPPGGRQALQARQAAYIIHRQSIANCRLPSRKRLYALTLLHVAERIYSVAHAIAHSARFNRHAPKLVLDGIGTHMPRGHRSVRKGSPPSPDAECWMSGAPCFARLGNCAMRRAASTLPDRSRSDARCEETLAPCAMGDASCGWQQATGG